MDSAAKRAKLPSQEARYSSGTASQVPFCFIFSQFLGSKTVGNRLKSMGFAAGFAARAVWWSLPRKRRGYPHRRLAIHANRRSPSSLTRIEHRIARACNVFCPLSVKTQVTRDFPVKTRVLLQLKFKLSRNECPGACNVEGTHLRHIGLTLDESR